MEKYRTKVLIIDRSMRCRTESAGVLRTLTLRCQMRDDYALELQLGTNHMRIQPHPYSCLLQCYASNGTW
jgi:hypothetical protein